ncbi:hypothetical protein AM455_04255 [Klebsiella pneumoniae]|nr:hypothetical protein AM455_04255 [Klebsiella pneumoniae]
MFAVVPCQWRRIIGGNSEVTRINSKKEFNRSLFQPNQVLSFNSCLVFKQKRARWARFCRFVIYCTATMRSSFTTSSMVLPGTSSPERICWANGFSICC